MRLKLNPIVKKDLQVAVRSMRISWGLFAYEAVLALAFMFALLFIQEESAYVFSNNIYSYLVYLFPVLAVTQVCIVALIVPIMTASSISGEKERQTFDIMLTTCMSPFSIVLGKLASAMIRILFFVAAGMPVMSLAFVVGGLSWSTLFYFLLTIVLLSMFAGSVGIFCSAFCKRSITSVIMSFVIYFIIFVLTFIPLFFKLISNEGYLGEVLLFLLFNPIVFFVDFFVHVMTGKPFMEGASRSDVGFLTYHLAQGKVWMFTSASCIVLLSFIFLMLAAWKVNPLHASAGRKRRNKGAE